MENLLPTNATLRKQNRLYRHKEPPTMMVNWKTSGKGLNLFIYFTSFVDLCVTISHDQNN